MDILLLLKDRHAKIVSFLPEVGTLSNPQKSQPLRSFIEQLSFVLHFLQEHLFAEVQDRTSPRSLETLRNIEKEAAQAEQACRTVHKALTASAAAKNGEDPFAKSLNRLQQRVEKYLRDYEATFISLLREFVPTPVREDLGQLFLDLEAEAAPYAISGLDSRTGNQLTLQAP